MHSDLVELGWTEEQWNRIVSTVTEEAQKGRVAAQMLPIVGPEEPSTVAVPNFTLGTRVNPFAPPARQLEVNSEPNLHITTIAVNVALRTHEVTDPNLSAALTMFRRAANCIARVEDALVFNGRKAPDTKPRLGLRGIDKIFNVTGAGRVAGIFRPSGGRRRQVSIAAFFAAGQPLGNQVVQAIIQAISKLEASGQVGPFACVLAQDLFEAICAPNNSLVLPRDRILPFLQGPLLRSSAVKLSWGAVIALCGNPIEVVVAKDIHVRFVQTTLEPRSVFRVSERVALRIKDARSIALLTP